MAAIFFITLFFAASCYYVIQKGDKAGIKFFGVINIGWVITLTVLAILSFVSSGETQQDLTSTWATLSELDKIYFVSIGNLVTLRSSNTVLYGVFLIVLAVLFVFYDVFIYFYYHSIPGGNMRGPYMPGKLSLQTGND